MSRDVQYHSTYRPPYLMVQDAGCRMDDIRMISESDKCHAKGGDEQKWKIMAPSSTSTTTTTAFVVRHPSFGILGAGWLAGWLTGVAAKSPHFLEPESPTKQ